MRRTNFFFLCIVFGLTGCVGTKVETSAPGNRLAEQMAERLLFMEPVAAFKFRNNLPVEDPEREEALLRKLAAEGEKFGLPAEATRRFFRSQMEAAKIVQRERIEAWSSETAKPPARIPDLSAEIRPRLDRLSDEMLQTFAQVWSTIENHPRTANTYRTLLSVSLHRAGYSQATADAAVSGFESEF